MARLKSLLAGIRRKMTLRRHRARLHDELSGMDETHGQYLEQQLERTLLKKGAGLPRHAALLIDELTAHVNLSESSILCVGCRNTAEIEHMRERGAKKVQGVDLYSEHPDIAVMDMHNLTFEDNSFDVLYSAHSFEHAAQPPRAAAQFLRVVRPGGVIVIEVPVGFGKRGTDVSDYASEEGLLALFQSEIDEVLLSESQPADSERNRHGFPIVRVIMRLKRS